MGLLRISNAASLAMHAGALFAAGGGRLLTTREIARRLGASEAHLAKVLQQLAKAGIARSVRGPRGGFGLDRSSEKVTLLDVYEAVEGPLPRGECLLGRTLCDGSCILGGLLGEVNVMVRTCLEERTLADLAGVFADLDLDDET